MKIISCLLFQVMGSLTFAATSSDTSIIECRNGHAEACGNVDLDAKSSQELFEKGCVLKNGYSCTRLGQFYEVKKNDLKAATDLYKKGCALKDETGCQFIRDMETDKQEKASRVKAINAIGKKMKIQNDAVGVIFVKSQSETSYHVVIQFPPEFVSGAPVKRTLLDWSILPGLDYKDIFPMAPVASLELFDEEGSLGKLKESPLFFAKFHCENDAGSSWMPTAEFELRKDQLTRGLTPRAELDKAAAFVKLSDQIGLKTVRNSGQNKQATDLVGRLKKDEAPVAQLESHQRDEEKSLDLRTKKGLYRLNCTGP